MSVYAWGTGTHNAELGTGELEVKLEPVLLEGLRGKVVRRIASCEGTVLAVTEQGELLTWGRNREGQAGHGTEEKYISVPRRVEALASERIACVAVGPNHSLAATVHGELFAFGRLHTVEENAKFFDVAVEMPGMRIEATRSRDMVDRSLNAYYAMDDTKAKHDNNTSESYTNANLNFGSFKSYLQRSPILVDGLQSERVVSVAAGYGYSIAITDTGRVYAWGFNEKCQLGLGHRYNLHKPQLVAALEDKFCVAAACGQQHTLVLTQTGEVYSFGLGVFGQLGHGTLHDERLPRKIVDFKCPDEPTKEVKIVAIACGSHHCLALDSEGRVFSWGSSEYAQQFQSEAKYYDDWGATERRGISKHGQSYYYSIPRLIQNAFEKKQVVSISCGNLHNMAVTDTGEMWTWGWGAHGSLGHGNKRFQLFPLTVNKLKGETIYTVAGGAKSTYAVTESSSSSFAFDFKQYVDSPIHSDLLILVGEKQIRAHKAIVFSRCPHLMAMLQMSVRFGKSSGETLRLPSWIDYSIFLVLLRYLYTDHVRIPAHFAPKLEHLASRLRLPRLVLISQKLYLQDRDLAWASVRIPPSSFSADMTSALEDPRFADVLFQMDDGTEITAHKLILIGRCEYFNAIFGGSFKERELCRIPMREVKTEPFKQLLFYIYSNEVEISEDNFLDLLLGADKFLASDMKLRIEQILEEAIQHDNVCDLLLLSEQASAPRLRKTAINYIINRFTELRQHLPSLRSAPNILRELDFLACKRNLSKPGELLRV